MKKISMFIILIIICFGIGVGFYYLQTNRQMANNADKEIYYSDGFYFVSEDFYFTAPTFENLVYADDGRQFRNNILRITAEQNVPRSAIEELAKEHNAEITGYRRSRFGDAYTFTFNETFSLGELELLSKTIENLEIINSVTISRPMPLSPNTMFIPNDPRWDSWNEDNPHGNNWGLEAINAPSAWAYKDLMEYVNVLILDTGFYKNHEDLNFMPSRFNIPPFSYSVRRWNPQHGTHVAGIIGAGFDDGIGISGMAPKSLMHAVPLHGFDRTDIMDELERQVRLNNVRVINFSMSLSEELEFGYSRGNPRAVTQVNSITRYFENRLLELIEENEQARNEFVFVTISGNMHGNHYRFTPDNSPELFGYRLDPNGTEYGVRTIINPFARIENREIRNRIIVVGAVRQQIVVFGSVVSNQVTYADFSQRGVKLDVTAPGVDIYSTLYGVSGYGKLSGTSMAAPFVSGLATMLFGINPDFRGDEVKQIIVGTSSRMYNMINAAEAVRVAMSFIEEVPSTELPFDEGYEQNDTLLSEEADNDYEVSERERGRISRFFHSIGEGVSDLVNAIAEITVDLLERLDGDNQDGGDIIVIR